MPFIGRDWRSPGEQWVKTHQGSWERLKLLEHRVHQHGFHSSGDSSTESDCSDNEENSPIGSDCDCKSNNSTTSDSPLSSSPESLRSFCTPLNEQQSNNTNETNDTSISTADSSSSVANGNASTSIHIRTLGACGVRNRNNRNESIQNIILQLQRPQLRESFVDSSNQQQLANRPATPRPLTLRSELPELIRNQLNTPRWRRSITNEDVRTLCDESKALPLTSNDLDLLPSDCKSDSRLPDNSQHTSTGSSDVKQNDSNWCVRQHMQRLRRAQQQIKQHLEFDVAMDESNAIDEPKSPSSLTSSSSSSSSTSSSSSSSSTSSSKVKIPNLPPKSPTTFAPLLQPHCPITLKCTREVAAYNTISEAFHRLDFCNAIRDIRRFNYICKLLHLLITQNLTSLSGCATKFLFNLLEQVAWQVASSQQNIHILHTLLHDLKKIMKKYYCWGRPLGSTLLWEQHLRTIEKICQLTDQIEIKQPTSQGTRLTDLPEELIRAILLRLSDYKDLMNSGQACERMKSLLEEQHIWRELCKYHFSNRQIKQMLQTSNASNTNWERLFHDLRKQFGLKEEYADSLFLCRHCRCLFWKTCGHPCLYLPSQNSSDQSNKENEQSSSRLVNAQQVVEVAIVPNLVRPEVNQIARPPLNGPAPAQPWQALFAHRNRLLAQQLQAQQQQQQQRQPPANGEEAEVERLEYKVPDCIPISPEAFLKFFSL